MTRKYPTSFARLSGTLAFSLLASTALAAPLGVGTFTVPLPDVAYPMPVVENYTHQAGVAADGAEVNRYDRAENPVLELHRGFDEIWNLGDEAWRSGGANGDGALDYSNVEIVDPAVWAANMAYVLSVTGSARDDQEALEAYLDDRRSQGFSVIDGMGPLLASIYAAEAQAFTTINHTLGTFDPNMVLPVKEDDHGTEAGTGGESMQDFVAFMAMMRGPEGTTSPSKYYYASPRPWRMSDTGQVVQTGTDVIGPNSFERYDSNVEVIPALLSARETRGRNKDGGYPSGHTNAGYLAAIAYAYALPQRYEELLTRASELGENRIVTGMHSPLDVMGGRTMSMAMAAALLSDPEHAELKQAALENMQAVMAASVGEETTIGAVAEDQPGDRWANDAANAALYRLRTHYGLPQDGQDMGQEMIVPMGAEVLLETRQPYLSAEQRRVVLYTTGVPSGYPVLDESNGWGRIDLVAAAGGYGAFPGDVTVTMDADMGEMYAADIWAHDISGPGMLTKAGSGTLTLSGYNSYAGGTQLEDGTLVAGTAMALGLGDLLVSGGVLEVSALGLDIAGEAAIEGGTLVVDLGDAQAGSTISVLRAGTIVGAFDAVTDADGNALEVQTADGEMTIVVPSAG